MNKSVFSLLISVLALTVSCFDDVKVETSPYAAITSFRLGYYNVIRNDVSYQRRDTLIEVRESGTMYPMTIDQLQNRIYNRDSLAYGSVLNSVTCTIGAYGTVFFRYDDENDSLVTQWSSDVAIDFTRPLKFYVVSTDESYIREYEFSLLVHTVDPDSLHWTKSVNSGVVGFEQKSAVCRGDMIYDFCMGSGDVPYVTWRNVKSGAWSEPAILEGITPESWSGEVTLFSDRFFTLCEPALFSSSDGVNWSVVTTPPFTTLYSAGTETDIMWALGSDGMMYKTSDMLTWDVDEKLPDGFPYISARLFCDTLSTNGSIMRYVIAGLNDEGGENHTSVWIRLSGESNWTRASDALNGALELPVMDNLSIFSYDGSLYASGTPLDSFWQSMDHGLTWRKCDRYSDYYTTYNNFMQLPEELKGVSTSFSCTTDKYGGFWILTGDGQTWRGAINRLNNL